MYNVANWDMPRAAIVPTEVSDHTSATSAMHTVCI